VPALVGVFIHNRYEAMARRLDKPVKLLSTAFLTAIVLFALLGQWELLLIWGPTVGLLAIVFNVISLAVGYLVPRLLHVQRRQAIALSLSIGVHNAALVMTIAMSERMLGNAEMAIPPAAYGLFCYVICAIFVWILNRTRAASAA
jgi:BASS family bile acid:Na+ symporter